MSVKTYVTALAPIFVCEQCWGRIRNGDGYVCVDIEAATELVAIRSRAKVNWHIFHTECDSNRTVADHVVWTRRFSNTNDLLLEMADLSERKAWFRATNWQGLIRRILADTNRFSDTYCVRRERKKRPSEMKTVMELGSEDNDRN